jgi:hypothetical protein
MGLKGRGWMMWTEFIGLCNGKNWLVVVKIAVNLRVP